MGEIFCCNRNTIIRDSKVAVGALYLQWQQKSILVRELFEVKKHLPIT